ncbi:RHS repeat-associated core domain-containing protein [Streptomyces sindenensis]
MSGNRGGVFSGSRRSTRAAAQSIQASASVWVWPGGMASTRAPALGYQSGWTDPGNGDVNMAARWYQPGSGAFTSRDTWLLGPSPAAQANRHVYANSDPVNGTDPTGHNRACACGGGSVFLRGGGSRGGGGGSKATRPKSKSKSKTRAKTSYRDPRTDLCNSSRCGAGRARPARPSRPTIPTR